MKRNYKAEIVKKAFNGLSEAMQEVAEDAKQMRWAIERLEGYEPEAFSKETRESMKIAFFELQGIMKQINMPEV